MFNPSGPASKAARRHGVPGRELRFDLRDDSRTARQNPVQQPDLAAVDSPPGVAARADRVLTAVISAFMEGFALYAMLYLPATYPEQSSSAETGPGNRKNFGSANDAGPLPSFPLRPIPRRSNPNEAIGSIEPKKNPKGFTNIPASRNPNSSRSFDGDRSSHLHWLTRPWNGMASRWRRWRQEREIAALVVDLAELDDRTLRDIGIPHRSQIEQAVRYGRDC